MDPNMDPDSTGWKKLELIYQKNESVDINDSVLYDKICIKETGFFCAKEYFFVFSILVGIMRMLHFLTSTFNALSRTKIYKKARHKGRVV